MYLYGERGGAIMASGLATRALFALLPGLLLVASVAGLVIRDPARRLELFDLLTRLAPPISDLLGQSLQVLAEGALQVTAVGLVLLLWGATGFFQTLDAVFAVILDERRRRNALVRALLGLGGTLLVLASLVGAGIVGVLTWSLADQLLASIDPLVPRLLIPIVVALVVAAASALAYRYIPTARAPWRAIALPAVVVAIAVSLLTQLFSLLAPHLAGVASLYGAIAAVLVLLAWLQLAAQVVILGAVWVWVRAFGAPPASTLPWPGGDVGRPDGDATEDATATEDAGPVGPGTG
ncbi:MAG TPA: YihY/virulence factor BrkB family protein [Candidatus Dormibacteraeota bacterium]|nr:YihY/virulence factor BrkB family protein [Candidatus Dormibacteraeota bacterium]